MSTRVVIDEDKCTGCGLCVIVCGASLIYMDNDKAKTKRYFCIPSDCVKCVEACPVNAITLLA
ncbi:4Fe-4S dicluster domain-containing protein [Geovibrio thiophilus]|uniref:4Fe-4S dicluster domain-containing protein n=1 Tax=Geovibrio thiophilus TaxID=139438 RepID=A0A410JZ05_9BACT|nr:4Fe-4S dicluster domain-containing protein [Geovibrio thiophilus]